MSVRDYRLRHAPPRDLNDDELEEARLAGFIDQRFYLLELRRREALLAEHLPSRITPGIRS